MNISRIKTIVGDVLLKILTFVGLGLLALVFLFLFFFFLKEISARESHDSKMSNHKAERFIFEMEARYPDISFRSLKDESYVQSAWEYRSFTLFEYTNFKRDVETYACLKKYVNSDAHNFRCTPAALDIVRSLDINLSSLKDRGLMGPMQNILHALFGALVTMVMSFFFLAIIMGVISSCCYWIFKRFSRLYSVGMSKVDVKLKIRV